MKKENLNLIVFTLCVVLLSGTIGYLIGDMNMRSTECPKNYEEISQADIDVEYFLEVSEDSIRIQGINSKKIYNGNYTDLDSLINADNL
jgi:hypothetical protein